MALHQLAGHSIAWPARGGVACCGTSVVSARLGRGVTGTIFRGVGVIRCRRDGRPTVGATVNMGGNDKTVVATILRAGE